MSGTGGCTEFWVLGVDRAGLRVWTKPDLDAAFQAQLAPSEHFGKGLLPVVQGGTLLVKSISGPGFADGTRSRGIVASNEAATANLIGHEITDRADQAGRASPAPRPGSASLATSPRWRWASIPSSTPRRQRPERVEAPAEIDDQGSTLSNRRRAARREGAAPELRGDSGDVRRSSPHDHRRSSFDFSQAGQPVGQLRNRWSNSK